MSTKLKAAIILCGIAALEGIWIYRNIAFSGSRFWKYLGFYDVPASIVAWLLALAVTVLYIVSGSRLPSVRENLFRISWLKLLGVAVAFTSGILEEFFFRKWLMDLLLHSHQSSFLQMLFSGITFGLLHGIWGLFGKSFRAFAYATLFTGVLGFCLAGVYLLSGRNLVPCIVAHFLINLFLEPGLVLAACRGEMEKRVKTL